MTESQKVFISRLQWMSGAWQGTLGPQSAEETWNQPHGGSMSALIRLKSADEVEVIELITIREASDSLVLHLRQFSPSLELLLAQDFTLSNIADNQVSFQAKPDDNIQGLKYTQMATDAMQVEVSFGHDASVTADFSRV